MDRPPGVGWEILEDANALTILPGGRPPLARVISLQLTAGEFTSQKTAGRGQTVERGHQKVVGSMVIVTAITVIITGTKSVTTTPPMTAGMTITTITIIMIMVPFTTSTRMSAGARTAIGHTIRVPIATLATMESTIAA